MLVSEGNIGIRLMEDREDDYRKLHGWSNQEHIIETYSGREWSLLEIEEKYRKRVNGTEPVVPAFIVYKGKDVGYLQFYEIDDGSYETQGSLKIEDDAYAIDLFIGEKDLLGKGIGRKAVSMACDYLFKVMGASAIYVDPRTENERGIRTYAGAGFERICVISRREMFGGCLHDSLIMRKKRK